MLLDVGIDNGFISLVKLGNFSEKYENISMITEPIDITIQDGSTFKPLSTEGKELNASITFRLTSFKTPKCAYYNPYLNKWQLDKEGNLQTIIRNNTIECLTNHFSIFTVFET